jgi:hypothetical protein
MGEGLQLRDPLFRLYIRFTNGEMVQHVMTEPLDSRMISSDSKYAVVSLFSCQNPSVCTDVTLINLRDVTFIKTERVTLEQLAGEHRIGIRSAGTPGADDRLPKNLAQVKFV